MSCECKELINVFSRCLGWEGADGEIVTYLASSISNEDGGGSSIDLSELAELVRGFFPGFSALPQAEQHDRLWNLMEQVEYCYNIYIGSPCWRVHAALSLVYVQVHKLQPDGTRCESNSSDACPSHADSVLGASSNVLPCSRCDGHFPPNNAFVPTVEC